MLRIGLSVLIFASAGAALAQERIIAPRLSCQQLAGLVAARGAVVIDTSPHTYDRAVSDQRFCALEQTTAPLYTPAADTGQCFVGYRCKDRFNEGRGRE